MSKRKYKKVQTLIPEIQEMLAVGRSHSEIEAYFKLEGDRPVHNLLKRERRKERKTEMGIVLRCQGRPPKGQVVSEVEKEYQIRRLKMENELLRYFLRAAGRK